MDPNEAKQKLKELFDRVFAPPEPPPMGEVVARLDAWLARNRPAYYEGLLPGLTEQECTLFEMRLGVKLPEGFRALYQWRDGHDELECFRGNRCWMTSDAVVSTKELMDGMIGFEPGWWERAWVPFLDNGAGSYLCVDTVGTSGKAGQFVEFWNRDADRPVVSPSIEHWLNGFVTSLERDRWEETDLGFECVESRESGGE